MGRLAVGRHHQSRRVHITHTMCGSPREEPDSGRKTCLTREGRVFVGWQDVFKPHRGRVFDGRQERLTHTAALQGPRVPCSRPSPSGSKPQGRRPRLRASESLAPLRQGQPQPTRGPQWELTGPPLRPLRMMGRVRTPFLSPATRGRRSAPQLDPASTLLSTIPCFFLGALQEEEEERV